MTQSRPELGRRRFLRSFSALMSSVLLAALWLLIVAPPKRKAKVNLATSKWRRMTDRVLEMDRGRPISHCVGISFHRMAHE